jgi:guanylate kinase
MQPGPLIILSGPSGSGKSTVIGRLLVAGDLNLRLSVSATTRQPRSGEQDGKNYHFWPKEEFLRAVDRAAFLEWAEVHGNHYGTLRSEVEPFRERGIGVILDIDVQGAKQVRQLVPDSVSIFLRASSLDEYERRLRQRATEDEASIRRRLEGARRELQCAGDYDYQVINDDLDAAVNELHTIIKGLM